MKPLFSIAVILLFIAFGCQSGGNVETSEESKEMKNTLSAEKPLLRHVVLFSFKEESSPEDVAKVEEAFIGLQDKIPQIVGFEWGTNNSPEGLNKGLTHCFLLTFESEEDRDAYLPHPAHKAFGEVLTPHLKDVTVVDYWTK
ncbi:Dabb family protein [uncultured Cyclobacterium sp.]|uniref:Dabb family protein n=1 Tax=uncultured Cyclobacterium sp. TaxID=453820 RepID=UPI0030EB23E0